MIYSNLYPRFSASPHSKNGTAESGIIKAEDFFSKKPEFMLWAQEVRKVNTDILGQPRNGNEIRQDFRHFNDPVEMAYVSYVQFHHVSSCFFPDELGLELRS